MAQAMCDRVLILVVRIQSLWMVWGLFLTSLCFRAVGHELWKMLNCRSVSYVRIGFFVYWLLTRHSQNLPKPAMCNSATFLSPLVFNTAATISCGSPTYFQNVRIPSRNILALSICGKQIAFKCLGQTFFLKWKGGVHWEGEAPGQVGAPMLGQKGNKKIGNIKEQLDTEKVRRAAGTLVKIAQL